MNVAIIDYGMGNLRSVSNAIGTLGAKPFVARKPEELRDADKIILPGVGAFGDGMAHLREGGWVEALDEEVKGRGKYFLGICLGMQLLATRGTEHGDHAGLGWIAGVARRIEADDPSVRIPHIGWNDVRFERQGSLGAGLGASQDFYFVHGYILCPEDESAVTGRCEHGMEFAAVVEEGNVLATQFHPEKSHKSGLKLLENFVGLG